MCLQGASVSRFPMLSSPVDARRFNRRRRDMSAATAGSSAATSSRPIRAAILISSRRHSDALPPSRTSTDRRAGDPMSLKASTRDKLKTVSTATICTALYKRGFRNQMIQDVQPLDPGKPTMVGEAFTLRYMPAREDLNPISVFQDRSHPQRKPVEECPPGAVFVIHSPN